ncbi:MAG: FHA domain-containing protein [Gammaproteobacteria bacterium]
MATLVIQIDAQHGQPATVAKSSADNISVGRSFTNDVVVTDPYVDPEQLGFYWADDRWTVKILGTTNPVFVNGKLVDEEQTALRSGDKLVIGRTHLTVFLEDHLVEDTRKLLRSTGQHHGAWHPLVSIAMVILVCAVATISGYQELSEIIKWKQIALGISVLVLVLVFWAGAWSLAGRLLRHEPQFFHQLFFTALMYAVLITVFPFSSYAEYAGNSWVLGEVVEWGFFLFVLTTLLSVNLSLASNLKNITGVAFFVSASILLFSYSIIYLNKADFSNEPGYSKVLKPPFVKISSDRSIDNFLSESANIFGELKEILDKESSKELRE